MGGDIHQFLSAEHRRLDALLERAAADPEKIDAEAYAEFRAGLLRHIAMEEKVLFPAAGTGRSGRPLFLAAQLRLEHGALAALLVPTPTAAIVAALRAILERHDLVEEGSGGVYDQCEEAAAEKIDALLSELKRFPPVKTVPHVDTPFALEAARRAVARAGYRLEF